MGRGFTLKTGASLIGHWGMMVTLYDINLIYTFIPASISVQIYLGNSSDRMGSHSSASTCNRPRSNPTRPWRGDCINIDCKRGLRLKKMGLIVQRLVIGTRGNVTSSAWPQQWRVTQISVWRDCVHVTNTNNWLLLQSLSCRLLVVGLCVCFPSVLVLCVFEKDDVMEIILIHWSCGHCTDQRMQGREKVCLWEKKWRSLNKEEKTVQSFCSVVPVEDESCRSVSSLRQLWTTAV